MKTKKLFIYNDIDDECLWVLNQEPILREDERHHGGTRLNFDAMKIAGIEKDSLCADGVRRILGLYDDEMPEPGDGVGSTRQA